jgi:hypothetical protein
MPVSLTLEVVKSMTVMYPRPARQDSAGISADAGAVVVTNAPARADVVQRMIVPSSRSEFQGSAKGSRKLEHLIFPRVGTGPDLDTKS